MKRNAIVRIVLYSVLALVLLGILLAGIGVDLLAFDPESEETVAGKASIDPSSVTSLSIEWAAGSIILRTADTDKIILEESEAEGNRYLMAYAIDDGELTIQYTKTGFISVGKLPAKDLVVTVPSDWICQELELNAAAVEVQIKGLTIQTLEVEGAACTLDFSGSVDQVNIDGAAADISLNCSNRISGVVVDGASCKMEIVLPKDCGFLTQMDGLSCKFHSTLNGISMDGEYSYGDQHCKIEVNGVSCDITVTENPNLPITQ